jgi:2-keto-4-pentenoate hydratase
MPDYGIERLRAARNLVVEPRISTGLAMAIAQSGPVIETLVARQWHDYQRRTPGTYFAEARDTLTLDEAYAVQMEVAHLRCAAGDAVVGYKVGCIGSGVVGQFGMSGPIHARLFRSEIRNSGDKLQYNAYANLAIEGEMAVRIGADGGIEAAFPVIELHHFVFRGPRKTLAELVANNGINASAVISNLHTALTLEDWTAARTLSVAVNGVTIDAGALWAMRGGAAEAIDWLRGDLGRFGETLKPGDLVLAGTPLGLNQVKPSDHVVVLVDDRKYVECRIS